MFMKQLSVFVENKQGALAKVMAMLSDNGINMRAVSIADTQDFGILRIIVKEVDKAKTILKESRVIVSVTEVVGVEIPDTPGSLSKVLSVLDEGQVNVEYVYAFVTPGKSESAYMVVRAGDNVKATEVLNAAGIHTLTQEDLEAML
ncbi:MAG: ACT domain-containing protein [Clostridia bacterium]|nr:ACT domain-containing protein [Clostridia bacterium]MBQ8236112.1 ACT domain-containing protein [Clostridia bacterium]